MKKRKSSTLRSLRIVGVHPVIPSADQFREALEVMWGSGLRGVRLADAKRCTREHYSKLFLLEMEIEPHDANVDWSAITQPIDGQPRENWQVPWDERPIGEEGNRWAFYLHDVQLARRLCTPLGECDLPEPTPMPRYLQHLVYEVPG
jgi:hypothetical protein